MGIVLVCFICFLAIIAGITKAQIATPNTASNSRAEFDAYVAKLIANGEYDPSSVYLLGPDWVTPILRNALLKVRFSSLHRYMI